MKIEIIEQIYSILTAWQHFNCTLSIVLTFSKITFHNSKTHDKKLAVNLKKKTPSKQSATNTCNLLEFTIKTPARWHIT